MPYLSLYKLYIRSFKEWKHLFNVNELNWMKLVADSLTALQLMRALIMNMCTLKVNPFSDFVMTVGYNGM